MFIHCIFSPLLFCFLIPYEEPSLWAASLRVTHSVFCGVYGVGLADICGRSFRWDRTASRSLSFANFGQASEVRKISVTQVPKLSHVNTVFSY